MTMYERGREAEWELLDKLRAEGVLATRTAGSHGIDVWAVSQSGRLTLFEVKSTKRNVYYPRRTKNDREQMDAFNATIAAFDAGTVVGYYAVRFGGGEWRFYASPDGLTGQPLKQDGGHDVPY
jgi:Holliday junction resolvase